MGQHDFSAASVQSIIPIPLAFLNHVDSALSGRELLQLKVLPRRIMDIKIYMGMQKAMYIRNLMRSGQISFHI